MSVCVIIPVLNESRALPENLWRLLRDDSIAQIVVVDGGSSDGTVEFLDSVREHPKLTWTTAAAGRGSQMHAGAQLSNCEWLIFHHADSLLPKGAGDLLEAQPPQVQWGGFTHQFIPSNWKLRLISRLHNWRCRHTGVVYGDQSMFVRRNFYNRVGGFIFDGLEDLVFSDQALLMAPSVLLVQAVQTSSRKFRQIGEFRALAQVLSIIWRYQRSRNVGNDSFFKSYR